MQSVSHKQILSLVGGVSSSNIQLTCFQIIYRKKMKIKSSNKSSFHSLAYKERDSVRRWEGKPHCAGPLKSYFQFTKCVIWLGKWASMCIRPAGSLIKEMPSLPQPLRAALASTSDLKQSGWLTHKRIALTFAWSSAWFEVSFCVVFPKKGGGGGREKKEKKEKMQKAFNRIESNRIESSLLSTIFTRKAS